ncbi:WXG100 family type VII secretion target [Kineosporia sp. J2-2]|uniref:ESAT-6-like protein n=1 Tax=Kineosporia corallincola TaxID=2835133 RepID=A0ABS5TP23_9ACTN|nr:WXG100 family type VII secretion target [Kineosporia corallincola]MBT0772842.1 WXG100 family type VII secretion target [Kineosporia corallincola]
MAEIDVNGMVQAASSIHDVVESISTEENAVRESISNLLVTWTGQSATTFARAMEEFYAQCDAIEAMLSDLSLTVFNSAKKYAEANDSANQQASLFVSAPIRPEPLLPNFG